MGRDGEIKMKLNLQILMKSICVVFGLLVCLGFLSINAQTERFEYPAENFSGEKPYRVLKVVDGDTIKIEYKGRSETVRLIVLILPKLYTQTSQSSFLVRKPPHLSRIC